jgi:hypothetical protein
MTDMLDALDRKRGKRLQVVSGFCRKFSWWRCEIISFGSFDASRPHRHLDGEDSDVEGRFGFSPDSEPCLPVVPGASAAVPPFGLVTCFCVAAPGFTLVPAAGPEESPGGGPAAFAIGAYNVIKRNPASNRALTAIVVTRYLL